MFFYWHHTKKLKIIKERSFVYFNTSETNHTVIWKETSNTRNIKTLSLSSGRREREINQKVGGGSQNQIQSGRKTKKTKQRKILLRRVK